MNCISSFKAKGILCLSVAWCAACAEPVAESPAASDPLHYRIDYIVTADPVANAVDVRLELSQDRALLREVTMRPDSRVSEFEADGDLQIGDGEVRWRPPAAGGTMRWRVSVPQQRNGGGYDAWLDIDWGLFRAEDIVPRARTRTLKGAQSDTRMTFRLPRDWSVVSQYYAKDGQFRVANPARRFDQPSGWIVLGKLGVRRETIAGIRVAVAGPVRSSVRRMDTLAFLNWTLPELARLLPEMPSRLTIVSAGEPMWRGGLSAPQSLFVHADRPLISENATSTLLHEVLHVLLGLSAKDGYDWIVEGLAEYYSLEILNRSGTISNSRLAAAKAQLAEWATSAKTLCGRASTGPTTALAVGIFAALDDEIRGSSGGKTNLDDVVSELSRTDTSIDLASLIAIVDSLLGDNSDVLHIDKLPGCRNITADDQET
ncbi:MAG: hypothetical protein OEM85_12395 [Gammaproteobacteria bacterium]|nr:hypothetical protein [Gammaproteobacteria bacterium]MDH3374164.1 hypothetical protein [Gammaproteobacteria bacterium]